MERIRDTDITVTHYPADGFTLSYVTDGGDYYHQRYIGYSVKDAKTRFKEYVYTEDGKIFRRMTRDDVLLGALRCICGGNLGAARELLGSFEQQEAGGKNPAGVS